MIKDDLLPIDEVSVKDVSLCSQDSLVVDLQPDHVAADLICYTPTPRRVTRSCQDLTQSGGCGLSYQVTTPDEEMKDGSLTDLSTEDDVSIGCISNWFSDTFGDEAFLDEPMEDEPLFDYSSKSCQDQGYFMAFRRLSFFQSSKYPRKPVCKTLPTIKEELERKTSSPS